MIQINDVSPGTIAWIYKYSRKNYWKVAATMEFEDLLQEGFYSLQYCLNKYDKLDPPHLMKMVQLCFYQTIVDLVKKQNGLTPGMAVTESELKKKLIKEVYAADLDKDKNENRTWEKLLGFDADTELNCLIAEAPELIKKVLNLFMSDSTEIYKPYDKSVNGTKETTNQRIKRLLGVSDELDFVKLVKDYLLGKEVVV